MAVAAWTANTGFVVGDIRRPTVDDGTGLHFKCTTAGTSGTLSLGLTHKTLFQFRYGLKTLATP